MQARSILHSGIQTHVRCRGPVSSAGPTNDRKSIRIPSKHPQRGDTSPRLEGRTNQLCNGVTVRERARPKETPKVLRIKVPEAIIESIYSKLTMRVFDKYANILKCMYSTRFNRGSARSGASSEAQSTSNTATPLSRTLDISRPDKDRKRKREVKRRAKKESKEASDITTECTRGTTSKTGCPHPTPLFPAKQTASRRPDPLGRGFYGYALAY